jgi:HEAT repeat protein
VLLRLGRSGNAGASQTIRSELGAPEHGVRAAAYQALGQLLEHEPSRLEPYLRRGIADSDPRVRRRVVLTAASARGLDLRMLLEHLRLDPDPQVRRVVKEVLRHAAPDPNDAIDEEEHPQTRSGAA